MAVAENKKLRYVLYVRKSTDDPQRQVRSIEDQVAESRLKAKNERINIVDEPVIEKKSAKRPDKRPLFRKMLNDIKKGKYDGIISWHPDRLARNMKEAGEIIDMVDEGIIKDLKFVTQEFSKDAAGLMQLGLAFVLSKQYSDNLSQNVTRGVRRSLSEGKSPMPKHGYLKDENGLYQPDLANFSLIRTAWEMRLKGESLEKISQYLNDQGYGRYIRSSGKKISMSKQTLSDIFKDPFYYGVLVQANQEVDLREVYRHFQPMITEKEYIDVQQLTHGRVKPYRGKRRYVYLPLKMMVVCSFCGNHMYPGASKGNKKHYLFYRCEGKFCPRKDRKLKRSVRGKVIFNFVYKFLEEGLNLTETEYKKYYEGIVALTESRKAHALIDIHAKEGLIKSLRMQIKDISYKLLDERNKTVREINEDRLEEQKQSIQRLEAEVQEIKNFLTKSSEDKVTIEQFLNLSKNAVKTIKSSDAAVKDAICRLIFLNFSVDDENVLSYQLKPPFDELLKSRVVNFSRESSQLFHIIVIPGQARNPVSLIL